MPAIITHHVFGMEVFSRLHELIGENQTERDAFLLGNIGPDPLFCLKALPRSARFKNIGSVMHKENPTKLLDAMHRLYMPIHGRNPHTPVRAFGLGFLCHYLLDSTVHPLVYAQQYAFCDAGVAGLSRERGGREVHALIETELDEYVLTTHLEKTVGSFTPHKEILQCSDASLQQISSLFPKLVRLAYELRIPPASFAASVRLYRTAQRALDSKRDGMRRRVDYARVLGSSYLHVQALTHTDEPMPHTPFTNSDHKTWPHPFVRKETFSADFDTLYGNAFDRAIELLPAYANSSFSYADCKEAVQHVNFYGKRV